MSTETTPTELRALAVSALKLAKQLERQQQDAALMAAVRPAWASTPGFFMRTNPLLLAESLEALRRRICAYGAFGDMTCDCKYGLKIDSNRNSEQTGCPELRSVIEGLLLAAEQVPTNTPDPGERR